LRLQGYKNIFAGGDIKNLQEEKTAFSASMDSTILAHNVIHTELNKPLLKRGDKKTGVIESQPAMVFVTMGELGVLGMIRKPAFLQSKDNTHWNPVTKFMRKMKSGMVEKYKEFLVHGKPRSSMYGLSPDPKKLVFPSDSQ
jgi:NADH dehydrogenase FAD-containing subunit